MAFKFITLFGLVAAANAGFLSSAPSATYGAPALAYGSPVISKIHAAPAAVLTKTVDADFDPHPQYSYSYDVQDSLTGDYKNHEETRDGDLVRGSYSLLEADGSKRTVTYTADDVNGFNAEVRKEPATLAVKAVAAAPLAAAPVAYAKLATPIASAPVAYAKYAAPIAHTYSAPLSYAAPQYAYAQPAKIATAYAPAYAAPVAKFAAPVAHAYAAPVAHAYSAPVAHAYSAPLSYSYAAPAQTYGPPALKLAASSVPAEYAAHAIPKIAAIAKYTPHPYIAHVTYSSPLYSYSI